MPMNPIIEDPDFNGVRYSRTSCDLRWDAFKIGAFKSFSVKSPLKPGKTWGNRAKPMGRTTGKFDPSGECEIYLEYFENLKNYLATKGAALGRGYKQVAALVTFSAFEPERGTVVHELFGVRIEEDDHDTSDSDDQLVVKCTLNVMDHWINGVPSVIETQSPF